MKMHRTQMCLTNNQYNILKDISKDLGISLAEYMRRIFDKHIEILQKESLKDIKNTNENM